MTRIAEHLQICIVGIGAETEYQVRRAMSKVFHNEDYEVQILDADSRIESFNTLAKAKGYHRAAEKRSDIFDRVLTYQEVRELTGEEEEEWSDEDMDVLDYFQKNHGYGQEEDED